MLEVDEGERGKRRRDDQSRFGIVHCYSFNALGHIAMYCQKRPGGGGTPEAKWVRGGEGAVGGKPPAL